MQPDFLLLAVQSNTVHSGEYPFKVLRQYRPLLYNSKSPVVVRGYVIYEAFTYLACGELLLKLPTARVPILTLKVNHFEKL